MRPSISSRSNRRERRGGALVWVLLLIVAIAASAVGGVLLTRYLFRAGYWSAGASGTAGAAGDARGGQDDAERWYTCGMHPTVLQQGPGKCPICHMKLTPLKTEADAGTGASAGAAKERKVLYWRAPMNPGYVSDSPGKSPMGMDLVPVYADKAQSASGKAITIPPETIQNMGIRTTTVKRGPLVKTIRTVGRVDYDEQTVSFINTKFDGWIEKLYVDETGVLVEKGQPLFDVYSPDLYSAQEEYLSMLRVAEQLSGSTLPEMRKQAARSVEAALIKLRYFDVSDKQIDLLRTTKEIQKTLTINSPATGIVTEKMALEGMYVKPGMLLYTIADLSRVWVYVDIYEYQLPWVHVGQQAVTTLPYIPGREFGGRVIYVYPYLEKQTRVIKVRLEFENPTLELKPEMYANVMLEADLKRDALLIPREAYIDSGKRQLVFVVLGKGRFEPRDIQVGVETEGGVTEVLYGLDEGEVVVTSGQFLIDAESKLREAVAKMMKARSAKSAPPGDMADMNMADQTREHPAAASQPARTQPAQTRGAIPPDAKYACPMETHPDQSDPADQGPYFSAEPGSCPRCGMTLKPIEELDWVQARIAAGGAQVAYTCPDHPHVFSEQGGQCPRCGHQLEPFKVMYTCPDPEHGDVISPQPGTCPRDGQELAPFRGIWLSPDMADENAPPNPEVAAVAKYRCPVHPLVHSDQPGRCLICARQLESAPGATAPERPPIPPGAKYVCPMEDCWYFAPQPGQCAKCGMKLKPIEDVEWARPAVAATQAASAAPRYVCPMHPDQVGADKRGSCPICGMQLVATDALPRPAAAPAAIAAQMNYLMEHYLELQKRFASDRTSEVPLHALGLVAAADELGKHLEDPGVALPPEFAEALSRLRSAALKTNGKNLEADRVTFVELSAAMRTLVERARPDKQRYPDIYIFHCPMSKGDWLQTSAEMANPYYGFKMLKCGELRTKR